MSMCVRVYIILCMKDKKDNIIFSRILLLFVYTNVYKYVYEYF